MKRTLGLIVTLCILLCTLTVAANEPPHQEVLWSVSGGTLTIKGTGAMADFRNPADAPWYSQRQDITRIVVEDGITHIGNLAFYDLKRVNEAIIPASVESVGINAFSYSEGTVVTVTEPASEYQFRFESDTATANAGDEFTVTVTLNADFKNVAAVQTAIVYDKAQIAIDENWYDSAWYETINEENLGYISEPMWGFVANNLRVAYLSTSGISIDEDSPLYAMGKTDVVIAKVKCKALADIENINMSDIMIKNSAVSVIDIQKNAVLAPKCGETQLTAISSIPMENIVIVSKSKKVIEYAKANSIPVKEAEEISVVLNGKKLEFDVAPFVCEDTVMLPLRAIFEAAGASIFWEQETFTVFSTLKEDFIVLQIGNSSMFKNNQSIELDSPCMLKDSRTMVSLNTIEQALGHTLSWDKTTKTVTITTK